MAIKIEVWTCQYCINLPPCPGIYIRGYKHPETVEKHEIHCFSNPNRIPYEGELSGKDNPGCLFFNGEWHPFGEKFLVLNWASIEKCKAAKRRGTWFNQYDNLYELGLIEPEFIQVVRVEEK